MESPLTSPGNLRVPNINVGDEASEFSPGLLDLHSFDTELIPEVLLCFCINAAIECNFDGYKLQLKMFFGAIGVQQSYSLFINVIPVLS